MTYADIFASQPFRNQLVTLTLTGKQIKDMLEQQWLDPKRPRILQVSKGFSYAWDGSEAATASASLAERMTLNGQPIDPAASYRVTVNNFSVARRRRLYGAEGRRVRRNSASTTSTPCTAISGPTARSAPPRPIASSG